MKKSILVITIAIVLSLAITACSSNSTNNNTTTNSISYDNKNGEETYTLQMRECGKVDISIESQVKSGSVELQLLDGDKVLMDESGARISASETISLDKGSYEIVIKFNDAVDGTTELVVHSTCSIQLDNNGYTAIENN